MIKISEIFGDFVPRDPAFARVFSRRAAILKIVEIVKEKALGTRLIVAMKNICWILIIVLKAFLLHTTCF